MTASTVAQAATRRETTAQERFFMASQAQLMWRKFVRHRLAIVGGCILIVMYVSAMVCEFIAPYDLHRRNSDYIYAPPQLLRFMHPEDGFTLRPFVYGYTQERNPETFALDFTVDREQIFPLRFLNRGDEVKFWGLFTTDRHLLGVEEPGYVFLLGTDKLGRDIFSRIFYGARISLTIGLVGVAISFVLGCLFGGVSGYFGGVSDTIIQRLVEFLLVIPTIPLWMALAAAIPREMPQLQVYFLVTIIISLVAWSGLARVVRGKIISLREEDYVLAARIAGETDMKIIRTHMLPGFMSYLIVNMTLAIPGMVLAETALSFLNLGIRPPLVSWGTLLTEAQQVQVVISYPWLLYPGLVLVITLVAFNFLGDGLRDAADPYK